MKVSEITAEDLSAYIRVDLDNDTEKLLTTLLNIAKEYIKSYTGISNEEMDKHEDIVIVVCILVQDMYDNRTLYVDKTNLNKTVESIINLYRVNLI